MNAAKPMLVAALPLLLSAQRCPPRQTEPVAIAIRSIDFAPVSGSYNISWTNRNRTPNYNEVKQYVFTLNTSGNATATYYFDIYEDGFWSDPYLGTIAVDFSGGTATVRYANSAGGQAPINAPAGGTVGRFWLACTGTHGRVRGNGAHGDDRHANVYIQIQSGHQSSVKSPPHSLRCV